MDTPHLTERADNYAKKLVKREPVDTRPEDVKMAEFSKMYPTTIEIMRRARQKRRT